MNKNDERNEQMVVALRVVGCELNKDRRIRRRGSKTDRGKKKQASPQEVKSANSFGLSGGVCVCWGVS